MPWPLPIIRQFAKIPVNPTEADFHGVYNKLLYTLFPADSAFTVAPQFMPASPESAECDFYFDVMHEDRIVFIVHLRSPGDIRYVSKRELADKQIRNRIRDLLDDCPIPVLHAISAIGTQLCFFTKRINERVNPLAIPPDNTYENDTAPRERWNYNVLEEAGVQKLRDVVEEIKEACAAL
ncbi:hypothetical protein CPB83DRAFT_849006 [Crepidotus variabilis]|uniref:Uncharacterized protein n=1 Tax=Crepidotus variabilis TaxID=179855 RepID=A0A9P6JT33_9AGAR|nr:hypothetical protein CPB83DRAFT_849006 [Crepidotus variabilis]